MKTPLTVRVGPNGSVTINVPLEQQASLEQAGRVSEVPNESSELELKLMSVDESDESKVQELNMSVLGYAEQELKAGRKSELVKFLRDNKDRFNPDLKEWLADTIRAARKGGPDES